MSEQKRKRYTKRQIVEFWNASEGKCWRCGKKIEGKPTPEYGKDWHLGHVGKAHWLGGERVAPEHSSCNQKDGAIQTKAAAKAVRIQAKAIGIKSKGAFPKRAKVKKKAGYWKHWIDENGRDRATWVIGEEICED